jgi:hypothetical protein
MYVVAEICNERSGQQFRPTLVLEQSRSLGPWYLPSLASMTAIPYYVWTVHPKCAQCPRYGLFVLRPDYQESIV